MTRPAAGQTALITGGAGFVATNLADRLATAGRRVRLFDNLSRAGVARNVEWLERRHGSLIELVVGDVRDAAAVRQAVAGTSQVFHFAAQVAVTSSLVDPVTDFEINARGTLNLLEAIRALEQRPGVIFTSTNKVYGHLEDLRLRVSGKRYEPNDRTLAEHGISEARSLDFHSPYGCSKGAAEQYMLDYARTFGVPAVVFRMSCIYGPHQFGTEDQGWVAHFIIQALQRRPLTLYGDGLQVRDVLFVDDLVEAMLTAQEHMAAIRGQAFNIGGGSGNTVSLLELLDTIGGLLGRRPAHSLEAWRTADQRYYVSDTRKFAAATGWAPKVPVRTGVERLMSWVLESNSAMPALVAQQVAS